MDGGELEDFELALAVGRDDRGYVADFFANEAATYGRRGGDEAVEDVGFFGHDELVGDLFVLGAVENDHCGPETYPVVRDVGEVHHGELAHALFKLAETGVDEDLALLGHVVFGVFGKVA